MNFFQQHNTTVESEWSPATHDITYTNSLLTAQFSCKPFLVMTPNNSMNVYNNRILKMSKNSKMGFIRGSSQTYKFQHFNNFLLVFIKKLNNSIFIQLRFFFVHPVIMYGFFIKPLLLFLLLDFIYFQFFAKFFLILYFFTPIESMLYLPLKRKYNEKKNHNITRISFFQGGLWWEMQVTICSFFILSEIKKKWKKNNRTEHDYEEEKWRRLVWINMFGIRRERYNILFCVVVVFLRPPDFYYTSFVYVL